MAFELDVVIEPRDASALEFGVFKWRGRQRAKHRPLEELEPRAA
jgi:hypothetical protein